MHTTTSRPGICRTCSAPVPRTGPGRHPATCSPSCRRADRAAAARARRRAAAEPTPAQPTPADAAELSAAAARARQRLRKRHAERAAAWADLHDGLATIADYYPSESDDDAPGSLGELGLSRIGPARGSRDRTTTWESDGSLASRARRTEREAADIRRACLDEAIRAARISARARGIFELDAAAMQSAEAAAEARAAAIIAAL